MYIKLLKCHMQVSVQLIQSDLTTESELADQESSESDDDVTICRQKAKPAQSDTSSSGTSVFSAAIFVCVNESLDLQTC